MEFTPEQQKFIDELINKKYQEAYQKARVETDEKHKAEINMLIDKNKKEIETLQSQIKELVDKEKKGGKSEDLTELQKRLVAMEERERIGIERERKALILSAVLESGNVVNGEQITALINSQIKSVDGKLTVINAEGQTRFSGDTKKEMSVKELVTEFLTNNPHFVKASTTSGSGSSGGTVFGEGMAKIIKRGDYEKLSPQEKSDFIKKGGKPID